MPQRYVKCPKDPEIEYLREVCEKVFRQSSMRYWCKTCERFQNHPKAPESPSV